MLKRKETVQCKSCRGNARAVRVERLWAIHCTNCDKVATKMGMQKEDYFLPTPFRTEKEANIYWNKWNRRTRKIK